MRLPRVHSGHGLRDKAIFLIIRLTQGRSAPGVLRTLFYRKEFFGTKMSSFTQEVMRGESGWSIGERELFAAFVSHLNQCVF